MADSMHVLRERYRLEEVLARRDGSATYRAVDLETGEPRVVKALSVGAVVRSASSAHSFDADDFTKLVELFEREARVLSHLDHPGIPRFIDHFTESVDGETHLYTVQELVEGSSLQQLVEEGKHFTEAEARDVCRRTAEILKYLHDRSPPLIHRDIKPSNVILHEDGTLHLVDFGSVRSALGGDDLDGKTIVGTYGYMPIEQYEARALPQSDFYALGMTLVYLLSHREPTKIPRTGMKLEFGSYVNVSERLSNILARMIEPAPEDRFGTADEILAALRGGVPVAADGEWRLPSEEREARYLRGGPGLGEMATAVYLRMARRPAATVSVLLIVIGLVVSLLSRMGGLPFTAESPLAVTPTDGELRIDLYRDFVYRPEGWPMGRSVGQTSLPPLTRVPPEDGLTLPDDLDEAEEHYLGYLPLGSWPDDRVAFALYRVGEVWGLFVDRNNDEDLTNDGPALANQGTGDVLAAELSVDVHLTELDGDQITRPYNLWIWFDEGRSGMRGRFYARNHYAGLLRIDGRAYDATAFEYRNHDALMAEAGLCIDLDGNGECDEDVELFQDGATVTFPSGDTYRLALAYP